MYLGALVWAFLTLHLFSHELAKDDLAVHRNNLRTATQVVLLSLTTVRLAWSVLRNEHSKDWVAYVVLLLFAAPLWHFVENLLWRIAG